jgi:hypothetical protein
MADTAQKPSFLSSMWSGVKGYVKGGLVGAGLGILLGAAVGALVGTFFPIDFVTATGEAIKIAGTASGAAFGAGALGTVFGSIGALSGMATDVVRSREMGQPTANDIVNVAKVSYAQGIATGHAIAQEQEQQQGEQKSFVEREEKRRTASAQQTQLVH